MAQQTRQKAQAEVVAAAKSARRNFGEEGMDLAPLYIVKIAGIFAADYAVQSCQFGDSSSQETLADQLRNEFLHQVRRYEGIYMGGGGTA